MALGLSSPWKVVSSEIVEGELQISIDFEKGSRFNGCPVHDTVERTWRHLNFWQYPTYLTARVPRVKDAQGKVTQVEVPWAQPGSGFTALFEALSLTMMRSMPVSEVARHLMVDDMALWRLLQRSVSLARESLDLSTVTRVGVDETKCRKGHHYISLFVDLDTKRVLFACEGKSASVLSEFKRDLICHGGNPESITTFSSDMSAAFLSGIAEEFKGAKVVLDKFHLVKMVSEAVDETRRSETKKARKAAGNRFLWLKNRSKLSDQQFQDLQTLQEDPAFAKTAEGYRLRLAFQELFMVKERVAEFRLNEWLDEALSCGVQAIEKVAQTFFQKRELILSWFKNRVSNGILEGINSVLQSTKNRARGYANPKHMILVSYLLHGKLDFNRAMPKHP